MLFLLTLFLQNVLGFTPLQAGLAFLPAPLGVVIGAGLTSRLIGRVGHRLPMTVGPLLVAVGLFWLSGISVRASYASHVLGPLLTLAVGLGMVFVSTSVVGIAGVRPGESGLASALLNVGRQLGGSLGIALLATVALTVSRNRVGAGHLSRAAVNQAVTAGYATAFEVAAAIAFAAFLIALAVIRDRRSASATPAAVAA
jgi:fucose permease